MLGFETDSPGGEPSARDGELEDVRWFTLAQARAAIRGEGEGLELPGRVSIARALIERWVAERHGS
jgi:NADH pyrophosphatase NudC (nudix superfamily)